MILVSSILIKHVIRIVYIYPSFYFKTIVLVIRAVATAPEKTPREKVKFSELRDHHQSIPRQILLLEKKVATPYLHGASAIRRRRQPDALNVILRLNRCLDGMR